MQIQGVLELDIDRAWLLNELMSAYDYKSLALPETFNIHIVCEAHGPANQWVAKTAHGYIGKINLIFNYTTNEFKFTYALPNDHTAFSDRKWQKTLSDAFMCLCTEYIIKEIIRF